MKNVCLLILLLIFIFYGCENQSTNTISTDEYTVFASFVWRPLDG